jgi:hypothetical protein
VRTLDASMLGKRTGLQLSLTAGAELVQGKSQGETPWPAGKLGFLTVGCVGNPGQSLQGERQLGKIKEWIEY